MTCAVSQGILNPTQIKNLEFTVCSKHLHTLSLVGSILNTRELGNKTKEINKTLISGAIRASKRDVVQINPTKC